MRFARTEMLPGAKAMEEIKKGNERWRGQIKAVLQMLKYGEWYYAKRVTIHIYY